MRNALLALPAVLLVAASAAYPAEDETSQACERQSGICTKDCDDEKFLWFFETADYDQCMLRCDQELQACMSGDADEDRFEVIRSRDDTERRVQPPESPVSAGDDSAHESGDGG